MQFDSSAELQNHQAKFCTNSDYEELEGLDKRLASIKRESAYDYNAAVLNDSVTDKHSKFKFES